MRDVGGSHMIYVSLTPARLAYLQMVPSITALLLTPSIGQQVARRLIAASPNAAAPTAVAVAQDHVQIDDDLFNDLPV